MQASVPGGSAALRLNLRCANHWHHLILQFILTLIFYSHSSYQIKKFGEVHFQFYDLQGTIKRGFNLIAPSLWQPIAFVFRTFSARTTLEESLELTSPKFSPRSSPLEVLRDGRLNFQL